MSSDCGSQVWETDFSGIDGAQRCETGRDISCLSGIKCLPMPQMCISHVSPCCVSSKCQESKFIQSLSYNVIYVAVNCIVPTQ